MAIFVKFNHCHLIDIVNLICILNRVLRKINPDYIFIYQERV